MSDKSEIGRPTEDDAHVRSQFLYRPRSARKNNWIPYVIPNNIPDDRPVSDKVRKADELCGWGMRETDECPDSRPARRTNRISPNRNSSYNDPFEIQFIFELGTKI